MNKKILKIGSRKKLYSYKDIYSYKNREILEKVNRSIDKGDNIVYCMCNGKNENRFIKMHTRKSDNGSYYTLTTSSKSTLKHSPNCPKCDESKIKRELIYKGRVYDNLGFGIDFNIQKGSKNKDLDKYNALYGLGELILSEANNAYIDLKNKIGKENDVLSYLYGYYDAGSNQSIKTYLNDIYIYGKHNMKIGDIMFNPKWLKCDSIENKNSTVVRSFIQLNKRFGTKIEKINQYLLLKYVNYKVIEDNQVSITLYAKGRNTKANNEKKITIQMDKFKFFNRFNMDKVESEEFKSEYYVSALVYADNGILYCEDIAFIPVYPGYCIPVETVDEMKIISELLVHRNRLTIKRIPKITDASKYNDVIPDLIVYIKGDETPIYIESFDYILPEYYSETLTRTLKYEKLSNEGKCKFLGIYNNLGWNTPPVNVILSPNFRTMDKLGVKVNAYISKITGPKN